MSVTKPLPHDDYIDAVTAALDASRPYVESAYTSDGETQGVHCYLSAVIKLDVHSVGLEDEWAEGLLLLWEWHTGAGVEDGEPERGPVWKFAEMREDGSTEYPTDLPVEGFAEPAAVADAARRVLAQEIQAGGSYNYGQWKGWIGGIIGGRWERADVLEDACAAWGGLEIS